MNKCSFFGFASNAVLSNDKTTNSARLFFTINVRSKRYNSTNKFDDNLLSFELWGSAAELLFSKMEHANVNILVIDASAKVINECGDVVFRVNDFKIIDTD
jgi:hypothetical protein